MVGDAHIFPHSFHPLDTNLFLAGAPALYHSFLIPCIHQPIPAFPGGTPKYQLTNQATVCLSAAFSLCAIYYHRYMQLTYSHLVTGFDHDCILEKKSESRSVVMEVRIEKREFRREQLD
jgi:hypothetical protein